MIQQITVRAVETPNEMEAMKELRIWVFVEEQGCPINEEFDEHDDSAVHAVALIDSRVVGTGRMFSVTPGKAYVGRMAVDKEHRRHGIGGRILSFLEDEAEKQEIATIKLHAQTYVKSFYEQQGYASKGEPFMEVDIEHILMTKQLKSKPKEG